MRAALPPAAKAPIASSSVRGAKYRSSVILVPRVSHLTPHMGGGLILAFEDESLHGQE
jgi:hypothetical protein